AQMAAEYDRSTKSGKQIESERWDSLRAAVEHYHIDMDHALQVRESAMHLFSVLRSVHRLPIEYAEWLSAAAMLYEVGDYVNRNGSADPRICAQWRCKRALGGEAEGQR